MRIQLWSYNYDPEPLGIGPVSTIWARTMAERGHSVSVIAAHPHYPDARWGHRSLPYREVRDGIPVTRLPLLIGRDSGRRRIAQELSFLAAQSAAAPFLGGADAIVSVSPSFPALLPAMLSTGARKVPWYLWLQDILPDGAATTGYVDESGLVHRASRRLESRAYDRARRIVVLSESFRENLLGKGVPNEKIEVAYNPATLTVADRYTGSPRSGPPRIICMGNIGRSQGLAAIVRDFESDPKLERIGARLVITGTGVAEPEVRAAIRTDRVEMPGLLSAEELDRELRRATLGAVTQAYDEGEFNVPSKLMNYLASALPVIASVRPSSEAARIVSASSGGWIAPPDRFGETVASALESGSELDVRSRNGLAFANANLGAGSLADRFEAILTAG